MKTVFLLKCYYLLLVDFVILLLLLSSLSVS
jgi:hypothetical protein